MTMHTNSFRPHGRYSETSGFNSRGNSFNTPEYEREQQILEHRRRLEQEAKAQKKPQPQAPPSPLEGNLKRTFEWLARTFPETFGEDNLRRPLKLHILNDIKQFYKHAKTPQPRDLVIKAAVSRYLVMDEYLETLVDGAPRYDLKGNICGEVTVEEAQAAVELLKRPYNQRL